MTINERPPDVDPIGDTGPIDWDAIESDHSSDEGAPGADEIDQSSAERTRQAARSDELRRKAEEKRIQEKRKEEEERQRRVEGERQRQVEEGQRRLAEEERRKRREESAQFNQQSAFDPDRKWKKKKKKRDSEIITCSLCNIKCTGQSAMDMHLRGKAHKTKERQAKWSSANNELSSHYTSIAAAPSEAGNATYGREDQTHNYEIGPAPSVPVVGDSAIASSSVLPAADDQHNSPSPPHHPHHETTRTRRSPVTADPRPYSPVVSPRASKGDLRDVILNESRLPSQRHQISLPAQGSLQREDVETNPVGTSPSRSRFARIESGKLAESVGQEKTADKTEQEKDLDTRQEDGDKRSGNFRSSKADEAQRKEIPAQTSIAGDNAQRKAAVTEGSSLLKGNNLPDVTTPKASVGTGGVGSDLDVSSGRAPLKATAAVNILEPRSVVLTEEGESPGQGVASDHPSRAGEKEPITEIDSPSPHSKQKPDATDSASKNQGKPFSSTAGPRPFAKTGPKSLGSEGKLSADIKQPSSSEEKKSSATVRPSESAEVRKSVSGQKPAAELASSVPSSDAPEYPKPISDGMSRSEDVHPNSVTDGKKAMENLAYDSKGEAEQDTGVKTTQSLENNNAVNQQGGPPGDSDRPPREAQLSTGVPLSVPAPRPMLRSFPAPNGAEVGSLSNGKKRKRFESIPASSGGESRYDERPYGEEPVRNEDRRASTGDDRNYEMIGSQRRRLDDSRDNDSRRRERHGDRSRDGSNGKDNRNERHPAAGTPLSAPSRDLVRRQPPVADVELEKYPLVPKEWLEGKMTVAEWRELRQFAFNKGDDVDKLAYKMLQEIILSPVVGIDFHNLAPFSRAMLKSVNKLYFTGKGVFARFSDYPEALVLGDQRYNSESKEDEKWSLQQDSEYLALCNVNDNLVFTFFPEADQPAGKAVWDGSDMPPRGSYGAKGQRKGPGTMLDGERAPRYPDSVAEDSLFKKIAAHVASAHRDRYRR